MTLRSSDLALHAARYRHHQHNGLLLTRRQLLRGAALGAGALAAGSLLQPALAGHVPPTDLAGPDPRPIPGGFGPWHVYPPAFKPEHEIGTEAGALWEQSTITDFDGVFASTDVTGWGVDGRGHELFFRCDMRFMEGHYIAVDGKRRRGSFGFI